MTTVPFVDLLTQYRAIEPEVKHAMDQVLSIGSYILGPQVEEFEGAFARFVGVEHAIGVSSGLDALRLALQVVGIGPADEVIIPANTYIATALAISALGARPVLIDCDPATYNMDVALIEPAITPRTKAILPVHLTGQAVDMDPVLELAQRNNLHVIEDAAQAHGTLYNGRPCGSMGIMGCFSFYPGKNLGAYGDGGLVTTNDRELAERLKRLRNYGQIQKYEHTEQGLNARLDSLQAAVLSVKLPHLPGWNEARQRHADEYRRLLAEVRGLTFQQQASYSTHIYHLFMVETEARDSLQAHLSGAGIQTGIHYPKPIHLQPAYQSLGYQAGDFPETERLARRILSLPMFPELTNDQIARVSNAISAFFDSAGVPAETPGLAYERI
jgi:dTDP-4-amino-4,6-dideoxygalactose transaminase